MLIISILKKGLIHFRTSVKLIIVVSISIFLIISAIAFFYKPIYSVTYNGEFIGYCDNKAKLQAKINEYMKSNTEKNIAFIQIDDMPEYKLCLLKRGITTNDDEIYNKVIGDGVTYYKYYALVLDGTEKLYVSNFEDAQNIVNQLKEKNSNNIDKISILEKYGTELATFTSVDECVSSLYEKKVTYTKSYATAKTTLNNSSKKIDIGITFIQPVSGSITSRFGWRSRDNHAGIDIGASNGTPIKAAAGGVVVLARNTGNGYGNYVIISHGNGVQTYYAHCSKLYVSEGETVSQGQVIAAVGSTGTSTGNHLHFEVRINGVAQDPQNYVY